MDENVEFYLSASPRSDMNPVERPSWEFGGHNVGKRQDDNSSGAFGEDEKDFYAERTASLAMTCQPTHYAFGENMDYIIGSDLFSNGGELQEDVDNYNNDCRSRLQNSWLKEENTIEYDMNLHRIGSYSYNALQGSKLDAPEEILESYNGKSLSFSNIGNDGCNEVGNLDGTFGETLPLIRNAYSLPNMVEGNEMQGFGSRRSEMDNDLVSRSVEMKTPLPLDSFSAPVTTKEGKILQSDSLPSLATKPGKAEKATGLPQPVMETVYAPKNGFNVSGKSRVRARRGQATDPHSIAERLRREKISERMKSLQELVPNPSKTDKASMLDEIIDYVRFLQLQVKLLSMSRLGTSEAVVPLIKHNHAGGSKNTLTLSSANLEELEFSPTPDQIAFEREMMRLMETNVSEAVQRLQRKGLCLMPIALASAISKAKAQETDDKFGSLVRNSSSSSNSNSSSNGVSRSLTL